MAELWSRLVRIDWWLLGAVTVLQMLSVVMMYGISPDRFQRQLIFAVAGIGVVLFFAFINYRYAQNYAYVLYGVGLVLLIGVLLFGQEIRGTTGWFVLFGITLQPVELVKILLVIVLARFFSDHTFQFNQWKYVAIAAGITLLYGGLVLLQPDLGSMAVFTIAFFGSLLLTNIRWRQVSIIAITATIVIILGWFFFLNDIQQARITTFIDPTADPLDQGYNVTQSIISVGSGQWFGRGLGLGTQSQLRFLPERETDFIFAVIAEELGFLGAGSVIALLGIVLWRLWYGMRTSSDTFTVYYLAGLALIIFVQSLINIGMNIGMMPVTGIPLPFVSAGGSSLLSMMLGLGIALNSLTQKT